ncbi:MAG: TonB-dependent receptor [Desulfovibrio sp.]|uniref:TonB-dependent receptor n=1 Tax=Desulfovibrio sp. 7SRBS1 TaxID=3378064 RepID=UPI003B3EC663
MNAHLLITRHLKPRFFIVSLLLLQLCAVPCALAVDNDKDTNATERRSRVTLPEVTVVANPIIDGNKLDRYAATTTVVSKDQIEDLNAVDLPQALVRVPGVTITRYNHVGSFGGGEGGAVFIRGMGSSRPGAEIKTYVDDVPMYMGPWNHPLMDLLPVNAADAIEVIKGPQPQRYGNTLSAINLVPKRQHGDDMTTIAKFSGGSYGTFGQSLELGDTVGAFDYYVGEGYIRSDGDRQNSSGSKLGYFTNMGYTFNDNWDARLVALGVTNRSEDPGPDVPGGQSEGRYGTNAQLVSMTLSHDYEYVDGSLKFFVNTGEGNWKDQIGNDEDNLNDFTFYGLRLKETVHPWKGTDLTMGLDQDWMHSEVRYTYDDGSPDKTIKPSDFSLTMPYIGLSQLIGDKDGFYAIPSAGVRFYSHNKFDSETAPHGGLILGYKNTEAHVALSRGIVYPGHDAIVLGWADWEDLEAETTDHIEVGLSHNFDDLVKAEAIYFENHGRNRYVFSFPGPVWYNSGEYDINGWEFTVNVTPSDDFAVFAGLTLQDVSEPTDLPYAPETTLSSGFTWRFLKDFTLNMDGQYVDKMYVLKQVRMATAKNTQQVSSHFLLGGRLSWAFENETIGGGELYAAVENLLDEDYEYRPDYPMPGRNFSVGIKLTF